MIPAPPSFNVYASQEVHDSLDDQWRLDASYPMEQVPDTMDGIDWNISIDDTQIGWDIGAVEKSEDSGDGFGSYEIIDAKIDLRDSINGHCVFSDHSSLNKTEEGQVTGTSDSDICWDISIENTKLDAIEDAGLDAAVETELPSSIESTKPNPRTDTRIAPRNVLDRTAILLQIQFNEPFTHILLVKFGDRNILLSLPLRLVINGDPPRYLKDLQIL